MDKCNRLANFFVWRPERAWAVAAIFFAIFFVSLLLSHRIPTIKSRTILVPAIAWTIFGLLELSSKLEKSNIRIDLLVTWPAVISISTVFTGWWFVSLFRGITAARKAKCQLNSDLAAVLVRRVK